MKHTIPCLFIFRFLVSCTNSQQQYSGNYALACNSSDKSRPSPAFLYTCNAQDSSSCQAFLFFKSQPPYNSVSTIAALTSSTPSEIARINNVTKLTDFPTGKEVIVPLNCSCSGHYFQANATFHIPTTRYTYYTIAHDTYQGLSTCNSLKRANPDSEYKLQPGLQLLVPIRCACPTRKQLGGGTKYLVTYSVAWGETLPKIAARLNVSRESILNANGFSIENPTVFPFTTVLIPLPTEPSSSMTIIHNPKPAILHPPSMTTKENKASKGQVHVGAGIASGSLLLLSCAVPLTLFLFHKKKTGGDGVSQSNCQEQGDHRALVKKDLLVEIASIDQALRLKVFEFEELKKATNNFSHRNRIKGSVFRGVFAGVVLAVKRMGTDVSKEVNILNKINHLNLVKLRGVCKHCGCFYLVSEYLMNGSLREWLQKNNSGQAKSWTRKIQIALDVANGLHYLHSFTNPAIVHKDVTSSNILLDRNLRAKITNFSLARIIVKGTDSTCNAATSCVAGTRGYLAPEYVKTGQVTPKIDVYAFGVVMLELITGKDAVFVQEGNKLLLSAAVASIMGGEDAETKLGFFINPPGLAENKGRVYAARMANLSLTCLAQDPVRRPSMAEVVTALLKIQVDVQKSVSMYFESLSDQATTFSFSEISLE